MCYSAYEFSSLKSRKIYPCVLDTIFTEALYKENNEKLPEIIWDNGRKSNVTESKNVETQQEFFGMYLLKFLEKA